MEKAIQTELWELLNLIDDYYGREGFNHTREKPFFMAVSNRKDGDRGDELEHIAKKVAECSRCDLHRKRKNTVPGEGASKPLVIVIGEGPGEEEDKTGKPFVGPAGKYLDKWLQAVGLSREETCFITNVVKCRPPYNRDPNTEEYIACLPFLHNQIEVLKPEALLTVGRISSSAITDIPQGIGALRGQVYKYRGIPLVCTYHPSAVLRNSELRRAVWEDLKLVKLLVEHRIP